MCISAAAAASDLGADGRLHFSPDALTTVDFEDAQAVAQRLQLITPGTLSWAYAPMTAGQLATHLVSSNDSPEGRTYLRWLSSDGDGLALVDAAFFATLTTRRISVSIWGRAEGMEPYLAVTYGNETDLPATKPFAWARIPAIRTGRETSDGWVEYSTGPIDGSVLDRPIHDLTLSGRIPSADDTTLRVNAKSLYTTDAFSLDALEVRPEAGAPSTGTCTAMTLDADCGAQAECFYGRCVDAAVAWHPVPPLSMQTELTTRVVAWATMFEGDRSMLPRAGASWVTDTMALSSTTATPRTFWGSLSRRLEELRDTHTHFGSPYVGINTPFAARPGFGSGALDVCFGPTVDDFNANALSYVLWQKGTGAPGSFAVGDVVQAIDGIDPKTWVDEVYHRYATQLPVVPDSDWSLTARGLAALMAQHAKTLTLKRCTSAGVCTTQSDFDVATFTLNATANGQYPTGSLSCRARFTDPVAGAHTDTQGGDQVLSASLDGGVLAIEFDGFSPTTATVWKSQLDAALMLPHDRIIIDARQGHGGLNALGDYLIQQLRSISSPASLVLAGRAGYDAADEPWLTGFDWSTCVAPLSWECSTTYIFIYQPNQASPPAGSSKVAWMNTDDLSNNDMVPRVLKGRPGLNIFGPWPTYGALGSDVEIPPLMPDWRAGTIAMSDGKYGSTPSTAEAATSYESGTGVAPDVVVTQTLSDVLAGRDTIFEAAFQWVSQ